MCKNHQHHTPVAAKQDKNHDTEHRSWNRRSFLQAMGLAGAGGMMLGGLPVNAANRSTLGAALDAVTNDRVLVVIRLKGGNDGLNTIVPLNDYGTYASLRPSIGLSQSSLYNLDADNGLPSFMSSLQSRWGNGEMKVIHATGYSVQNLSHFGSSDIWATGDVTQAEDTGILGRFLENEYPNYLLNPPSVPAAIQIGNQGNSLFDGTNTSYAFNVADPNQLAQIAQTGASHDVLNVPGCTYGDRLQFMRSVTNTTFTYAGVINQAYTSSTTSASFNNNDFADQLAIVSRLIKGNLGTKIYMVSIGGFDTHANQANDHAGLMTRLTEAVDAFYTDLAASGYDQNVVAMTISEFGRRVEENGSNGTDHGAAAPSLVFGPALNGNGFIGSQPSLTNLDVNGNMIHTTDFRQIYATMLKDWLCADPAVVDQVLLNGTYSTLNLGFDCSTVSVNDESLQAADHMPLYPNNRPSIYFRLNEAKQLDIRLFDTMGREVAMIANDFYLPGEHTVDVMQSVGNSLRTGQYIYQINAGNKVMSKSIMVR